MYKVGIIGPESTGKSTLARELAEQFKGTYVPEYAREYVERKGRKELTYDEVCEIAREQIKSISEAGFYFFDTELIVTKVWFEYAFGKVPEWLTEAIKTYPMDLYLLTYPDIPWVPDPARYNGSQAMREELFDRYEEEVKATGVPYYVIRHDL
ncbi:MAG: ATP-binding protein [Paludibacteraceae bacterium]|nr:ATP-binding protein [Paludibacteraceae bacterium]